MNFQQRNNNFLFNQRKPKGRKIKILILFIVIILLSFSVFKSAIFYSTGYLFGIRYGIGSFFKNNIELIKSKKSLIEENNKLKEIVDSNSENNLFISILKKENEELKASLGRKTELNQVIATVLSKPSFSPYDTLIIDIGSNEGILVGDKVLTQESNFIGYISEVYYDKSKVTLFSAPGEKTPVIIGKNSIEKEAIGLGAGNFLIQMPVESDVKEGDSIIIPSITPNIFGVVEKVEFKESDSYQKVYFKSPVNIYELKFVSVILSTKK